MEPAQINIFNDTVDGISLNMAFYQKNSTGSTWPIVMWRTILPRVGQKTFIAIPDNYAVQVIYVRNGMQLATPPVPIIGYKGAYQVSENGGNIILVKTGPGSQENIVRVDVDNSVTQNVEIHITLGGDIVYLPISVRAAITVSYMINPSFYAAFVSMTTEKGTEMPESEVAPSEIAINPGQTAYISGNKKAGYKLAAINGG